MFITAGEETGIDKRVHFFITGQTFGISITCSNGIANFSLASTLKVGNHITNLTSHQFGGGFHFRAQEANIKRSPLGLGGQHFNLAAFNNLAINQPDI